MDKASFIDRIWAASEKWSTLNDQELRHLAHHLRSLGKAEQFDALVSLFIDPPPHAYLAQEYAGRLLLVAQPPCPLAPRELLLRTLPRWERSIEQLPQYASQEFGLDAVAAALDQVDASGEVDRAATDTVRFWLRISSARGPG